MRQGSNPERLSFGPNVWLGAGSVVMDNVGRGCVIGAGSVIINDIPDYSVAAGNPARIIKSRLTEDVEEQSPENPLAKPAIPGSCDQA
ncbi:hypothetical protein ACFL0H_04575 [Thermodesulfobacteriota bacterium]